MRTHMSWAKLAVSITTLTVALSAHANKRFEDRPEHQQCMSYLLSSIRNVRTEVPQEMYKPFSIEIATLVSSYRINIMRASLTAHQSRVRLQILSDRKRDFEIESILQKVTENTFKAKFDPRDRNQTLLTEPMTVDEYVNLSNSLATRLRYLFIQKSKIHSSVALSRRARSPQIDVDAKRMSQLLVRKDVAPHLEDANQLVNDAHRLLMSHLTIQELAYFSYEIFDETVSYELDQEFEQLSKERHLALPDSPREDHRAIQKGILEKFVSLAESQARRNRGALVYLKQEFINEGMTLVKRGRDVIREGVGGNWFYPAELDAFENFIAKFSISLNNLRQAEALAALTIDWNLKSKASSDFSTSWYYINQLEEFIRKVRRHFNFLTQPRLNEIEQQSDDFISTPLSIEVTRVTPSSGGIRGSSYEATISCLPNSFSERSHKHSLSPGSDDHLYGDPDCE